MPLILQAIHKEASASDPISLPEGARTFRVGRLEDNDVQINHSSISAKHALLKGSEINGVELVDCDSSNGTFVNGVRIERKELQQGDVVKFAYLAYRVVEGDALGSGEDAAVAPAEKAATPSISTADLVAKVQALEELNRSSESQLEEIRSRESQWMAEIESRKKRIAELEKENQTTRLQLQKVDEDANLQKDQIGKLQEESKARFELLSRAESTSGERQSEIEKLKATIESLQSQVGDLQKESGERLDRLEKTEATLVERSAELTRVSAEKERFASELNAEIEARQSVEASLASRGRQCEDLQAQLEKSRTDLQGRGAEVLDREKMIAAVQFEKEGLEKKLATTEEQVAGLEADCVQWRNAYEALKTNLEETNHSLQLSLENGESQRKQLELFFDLFRKYLAQLHQDWGFWKMEAELAGPEGLQTVNDCFEEAERLRLAIRAELDDVEPIWEKFGKRVQVELEKEVTILESQISELNREREEKEAEVASLTEDVRGLREEVDVEVRRAQGLSRRGVQSEIPERFESMVIAKDRERQILLSLVSNLEFLEQIMTGYRRSKKLREVVHELEEFSKRLVGILETNGVIEFTLEPGTELTLKHRKEVQILEKKGLGTREYGEQPFHPGVVKKVIRSGYRAGQGEGSVLLRKVEVLIRETER